MKTLTTNLLFVYLFSLALLIPFVFIFHRREMFIAEGLIVLALILITFRCSHLSFIKYDDKLTYIHGLFYFKKLSHKSIKAINMERGIIQSQFFSNYSINTVDNHKFITVTFIPGDRLDDYIATVKSENSNLEVNNWTFI